MLNNINIIDYKGNSNRKGKPIGHPIKIVKEFYNLLKDISDTCLFIPRNYEIQTKNVKYFNFYCDVTDNRLTIKFLNIIYKLINIISALLKAKTGVLWFINVDFMLFVVLSFIPKFMLNKNIAVTMFLQEYSSNTRFNDSIKNFFISKGIKKVNCVFSSNENINFNNVKMTYVPDYIYDKDKYLKYLSKEKKNQVVCVGTMNKEKEIIKLIEIFNKIEMGLVIYGYFYDTNDYLNAISKKSDNITIENKYLSEDEYYTIIGESKYLVLPYCGKNYKNRTSGVLIESLFLNTIPIAHESLLNYNGIKGLSYNKLEDIALIDFNKIDFKDFYKSYDILKSSKYNADYIRQDLIKNLFS